MERAFKVFLVVFITLYIELAPVIHGCCPSCPTTNPQTPQQETPQLTPNQMDMITNQATQMEIKRLQNLSITELNRETNPIVTFTREQMEMVSREYPEYLRRCKRVIPKTFTNTHNFKEETHGNRLDSNITCTPPLPRLHEERMPQNFSIQDPCQNTRGKRSLAPTCHYSDISVCTPVQSYVQAVFAHDHNGNVVQLFQNDEGDDLQILIEERCLDEGSIYPNIISCCGRKRTVPAVVVSLEGSNIGNIHVIDIQVSCCTARVISIN